MKELIKYTIHLVPVCFLTGLVLFLEEDNYVLEDFVSVLQMAETIRSESHPECDTISLGTYSKYFDYNYIHQKVSISGMF